MNFADMVRDIPDPGNHNDPDYAAKTAGLDARLFKGLIQVESGGKEDAVSSKGALGKAQVKYTTAAEPGYGMKPFDPKDLTSAAQYLKKMIDISGGDVMEGLSKYNAGPGAKRGAGAEYANKVFAASGMKMSDLLKDIPDAASPIASSPAAVGQQVAQATTPQAAASQTSRGDRVRQILGGGDFDKLQQNDPGFKAFVNGQMPDASAAAAYKLMGKVMPKSVVNFAQNSFQKTQDFFFKQGGTAVGKALTAGESSASITSKLNIHDRASIARDVVWKREYTTFLKDHPDYHKFDEELYHAAENPGAKLSPEAQMYKTIAIDKIAKRNKLLFDELKAGGVHVGEEVDPDKYIHRQVMEAPESKSWLQTAADVVDPSGTLSSVQQPRGFSPSAAMLKERTAGTVKSQATGEEAGYLVDPTTNEVHVYKNQKVITAGKMQADGTVLTKSGELWDTARGTTKEVEQHTPIRYQKSALASSIETNRALNDAVANMHFMRGLKTSPEFQQFARPPGANTPKEWVNVDIPGYHGLDGWKMDPKIANAINDYTLVKMEPNVLLQGLNRIAQGSIFLSPVGHIMNVKLHAMVEAGLFGGVRRMIDGGIRAITPGEKTLTRRAVEAVITKNADYLRYVRESSGMRGANTYIHDFSNDLLKNLGKNPQQLDPVAKALGYATGATLLRGIYSASNATLWGAGDYMMMKAFLAREAEGTARQVAQQVEKHIPSYQIPGQVLGSRGLSQILKNPAALAFSRYEYNRLASYGNMLSEVIKPQGIGTRAEAIDQIAALAFHFAVTYPMVNYAIQKATGNPNAELQPFGPMVYLAAIKDYASGKKNLGQATVGTVSRLSSVAQTAGELMSGKDYTGKNIEVKDLPKYLASKTLPTKAIYDAINPRKGMSSGQAIKQFLESLGGIKDPTPEQVAATEKFAKAELARRNKK